MLDIWKSESCELCVQREVLAKNLSESLTFHVIYKFFKDLPDLSHWQDRRVIFAQHSTKTEMLMTVKEDELILNFILTSML